MKRIFLCLLALAIPLWCLAGCADASGLDPQKPVTLTMWHIYGEQTD